MKALVSAQTQPLYVAIGLAGMHSIAAGSVVTKDVPDHAIMMGVPARQHGWACECGETLDQSLHCPKCGRNYREGAEGLEEEVK